MRPSWAFVAFASAFAPAGALGGPEPADLSRDGLVSKTGHYRFETYFYRTGMRVFAERPEGTPLAVSGLAGTATFYHPNSPKPWFSRPLSPETSASSLDLVIGWGDVPAAGVKVKVEIAGLPEPSEPTVTFTVPLTFVTEPTAGNIVASTRPVRPQGNALPLFSGAYGLGSRGLGDSLLTRHGPIPPFTSAPTISLYGYGRVPSASPAAPVPIVSGHAVWIMPSAGGDSNSVVPAWHFTTGSAGPALRDWTTGRDVPLAKPWLRPID